MAATFLQSFSPELRAARTSHGAITDCPMSANCQHLPSTVSPRSPVTRRPAGRCVLGNLQLSSCAKSAGVVQTSRCRNGCSSRRPRGTSTPRVGRGPSRSRPRSRRPAAAASRGGHHELRGWWRVCSRGPRSRLYRSDHQDVVTAGDGLRRLSRPEPAAPNLSAWTSSVVRPFATGPDGAAESAPCAYLCAQRGCHRHAFMCEAETAGHRRGAITGSCG